MRWWTISVTGYGSFEYFGTRKQAQERAEAKAQWEGGRAMLDEADSHAIKHGIDHILWRKEHLYPLERWEREALRAAETQLPSQEQK